VAEAPGGQHLTKKARLLLFGDSPSFTSKLLIEAAVRAARQRGDVQVVGICDASRRPPPGGLHALKRGGAAIAKRVFDREQPIVLHRPMFQSLQAIADRLGVPLIVPPGRDINAEGFVTFVRETLQADYALSLICLQIFRPALLNTFRRVVNYHNGLLPAYKGVRTTSWSVYHGETHTGFTYHLMTEKVDAGPILIQESLPVPAGRRVAQLEWDKTVRVAARMDEVVGALLSDDPGRAQVGASTYFRRSARERLLTVQDPSTLSWDELQRRLRAFEMLTITIGGHPYDVTELRRIDGERPVRPGLAFGTSDGVQVEPTRFRHMPFSLYRWYRRLEGRRSGKDLPRLARKS